jgi:AcrR family transcriptional regulator
MTMTRPMRADAHRNEERLVTAAKAAFAEHGTNASLEDIARRAGVGIATLYRHFPTRNALLEGAFQERFEALLAEARDLLGSPSPAEALATWLKALLVQADSFRGLAAPLAAVLQDQESDLSSLGTAALDGGARLLARAQQSGAVRPDADFMDLVKLIGGIACATERTTDPDRADRLLGLVMDGLTRPEGHR